MSYFKRGREEEGRGNRKGEGKGEGNRWGKG